jgi:hypothetical protein
MVERVAGAIYADDFGNWDEPMPNTVREMYLHRARAAILAMREATPAMVKAEADLGGPPNRMPAALVFDVMIVAALSEGAAPLDASDPNAPAP